MLNELFVERWSLLLAAIEEVDARPIPPREKLDAVAGFIIDSYRHDPELMKVIIVEVTRAANSFGRTHLPEISQAYDLIAKIVRDAQASGDVPRRRRPRLRLDVVLRRDRAAALGLGVRADPRRRRRLRPRPGRWSSTRSAAGSSAARRNGRPRWMVYCACAAGSRRREGLDGQRDRQAPDVDRPGRRHRRARERRRDARLGRDLAARSSTRTRPNELPAAASHRPARATARVGEMVFDVSERVSTLVREEIELAKAEVSEKVTSLRRAARSSGSPPASSPSSG